MEVGTYSTLPPASIWLLASSLNSPSVDKSDKSASFPCPPSSSTRSWSTMIMSSPLPVSMRFFSTSKYPGLLIPS